MQVEGVFYTQATLDGLHKYLTPWNLVSSIYSMKLIGKQI